MQPHPTRSVPPFRYEPPVAPSWAISRPRLLTRLAERFEVRATVMIAGGGFGKSVVLAQAIAENRLQPSGTDVWLRLNDRDNAPEYLLAGLTAALTPAEIDPPFNSGINDVVDAAWSLAPGRVAIILDDTQRIDGDSDPWMVIRQLIDELPRNASIVLSGRTAPNISLGRWRGTDDLLEIDERELEFESAEALQLAEQVDADPQIRNALPRWPALATLTCRAGHRAGIEYLWDEVIASLPPERRDLLATLSRFSSIDDKLVAAVAPGCGYTTAELVEGLPLVETDDHIVFRLHDLWSEALSTVTKPADVVVAAGRAGRHLLEIDELRRAAEAFALAGDHDGIAEVVRHAASKPIGSALDAGEAAALLKLLPSELESGATGELLRATMLFANQPERALDAYQRVLELAERDGSEPDAVLAYWRLTQLSSPIVPRTLSVPDRLQELADAGYPLARTACANIRSVAASLAGDVDTALAELENYEIADPAMLRGSIAGRLLSLGRPELVPTHLDAVLNEGVSDPLTAQAVWFRGEISPDDAWPIAKDLPAQYRRRSIRSLQLNLTSIVAQVAVAAGELAEAERLVAAALATAVGALPFDAMYARAAAVTLQLARGDEEGAHTALATMNAELPVLPFPAWPYLSLLVPLRGLHPEFAALDDIDLGPAMSVARDAGTALADLRAGRGRQRARALPWTSVNLLRVHVPVPLLVELAVAASDVPAARSCLEQLPGVAAALRPLCQHADREVRSAAERLLTAHPLMPSVPLRATTLGRFTVMNPDGEVIIGPSTRSRVRELAALLVARGSIDRAAIAAELWPSQTAGKGRDNLRTNLSYLLRDLTVDGQPPYVTADNHQVALDPRTIVTDASEFEDRFSIANTADQQSNPSVALAGYLDAAALYRGDYLPDIDTEYVRFERIRFASLAHTARCRAGELLLAKGGPEQALAIATEALQLDAHSEWAHRVAIAANDAIGATAAARRLGIDLIEMLDELGVRPERQTITLLDRLGVPTGQ